MKKKPFYYNCMFSFIYIYIYLRIKYIIASSRIGDEISKFFYFSSIV